MNRSSGDDEDGERERETAAAGKVRDGKGERSDGKNAFDVRLIQMSR